MQPNAQQFLQAPASGYCLYLVGFTRDSEKQCAFAVAVDIIDAYAQFKQAYSIEPDKIQEVNLEDMGYFLLKRKDDWNSG
mgnify:FL=1